VTEERERQPGAAGKRTSRGLIALGLLLGLGFAAYVFIEMGEIPHHSNRFPHERDASTAPIYTEEAKALLGGLDVGDPIPGGWYVASVHGPTEGFIAVALELEGALIEIRVLRIGTSPDNPPLRDDRFDFHFTVPPDSPPIPDGAIQAGLVGLSGRIVAEAPIPAEM
jgi:hypothetical protein